MISNKEDKNLDNSNNKKRQIKGIFERIKNIKNIEIIVLILFVVIALLILFSGKITDMFALSGKSGSILSDYSASLESRVEKVLSKIEGAGDVSVMIYFEGSSTIVPAMNSEKETQSNGDKTVTTEKKQLLTSGGKLVVLGETEPKISGIIIVAEGAKDASVKLELVRAVATLLNVSPSQIEIFSK